MIYYGFKVCIKRNLVCFEILSYRFFIWQLKRGGGGAVSEKSLRTNVGGIRENVTVRYNGGGGVKLLFFCVTYFLNDPYVTIGFKVYYESFQTETKSANAVWPVDFTKKLTFLCV